MSENFGFFGGAIAFGFVAEAFEHVDDLTEAFDIEHGAAGARIGEAAENHFGVLGEEADELLEAEGIFWRIFGRLAGGCGRLAGR